MDKKTRLNSLTIVLLTVVLALIPLLARGDYILSIFVNIFLFAYLGQCWNLLGGYAGYLSLGHTVFFGLGAYASSLLYLHFRLTPWLGMVAGAAVAGLVGLFIGFLSLRYQLRGIFFAMITLAFGVICKVIFTNAMVLGGAQGVLVPLEKASFLAYQFDSKLAYYYIGLTMLVVVLVITLLLEKHRFGFNLLALKDNEEAAEALGIDTNHCKLWATCLSAFLTAFGGTYYAQYLSYISPDTVFSIDLSIEIVLVAIVGGMGTLFGPTLGASLLTPLSEVTRSLLGDKVMGLHVVLYGIILIVFCLGLPGGIIPSVRQWLRSRSSKNA